MSNNLFTAKFNKKKSAKIAPGTPSPVNGGVGCHAPDDIVILELLEERDLADGRARHALVLRLEPDLLERDDLVRGDVFRFVHDAVSACVRANVACACDVEMMSHGPPVARVLDNKARFSCGTHLRLCDCPFW